MSACVHRRVLLTGGRGFVGRHLRSGLMALGHEVLAPTRAELDLTDEVATRAFLRAHRVDAVVHAAKDTSPESAGAGYAALRDNLRMYFSLERSADLYGKLIHLGSGAEYDRRRMPPHVREEAFGLYLPEDDYGLSKYVISKHLAGCDRAYHLRLFGIFGPHEDWRRRFISLACCKAMWGLPITIRRNARFDYMWVSELTPVVDHFLRHDPSSMALNVCSGAPVDLLSVAQAVAQVSGTSVEVVVRQEGFAAEYSGDNARLRELIPGLSFSSVADRLPELYAFYSARREAYPEAELRLLT